MKSGDETTTGTRLEAEVSIASMLVFASCRHENSLHDAVRLFFKIKWSPKDRSSVDKWLCTASNCVADLRAPVTESNDPTTTTTSQRSSQSGD